MNSLFYLHLSWFFVYFLVTMFFLSISLYLTVLNLSVSFSFDVFSSWFLNLSVSFSFDVFSSWFSFTVLLISSVIMVYSFFYMNPYSKPLYFIWLTSLFVLSMLVVINFTNIFFIMLGWDGLGLISFFLIMYYQNNVSLTSGLFTVLMNRLGDCFFILLISVFIIYSKLMWLTSYFFCKYLVLLMVVTFCTKSAIYPFSSWLPLAMAAPTPISALVHSSTLVTAGLYLMIRFYYIFYQNVFVINMLLLMSVFTSFYAGLNSLVETDLKKLIALSTLSHLGFIGLSFSSGLTFLAFFHLLVHALFKSVLFMSMGDIMTNLNHSQDVRFLSSGILFTPYSCSVMMVSLLNLVGMPSMSGFYSKDLILESLNFSNYSFFVIFIVYTNLLFTYFYTLKLFTFFFNKNSLYPISLMSFPPLTHTFLILIMILFSITFSWFWLNYINLYIIYISVPFLLKFTPLFIFMFYFLLISTNLSMKLDFSSLFFQLYFKNMLFLTNVFMPFFSSRFLVFNFTMQKSGELGLYNMIFNTTPSYYFKKGSYFLYSFLFLNPLFLIFFFSVTVILLF